MKKRLICLILAAGISASILSGCNSSKVTQKDDTAQDVSDSGRETVSNENEADNAAESEIDYDNIHIYDLDLKENEGVTEEGVIFDKTLKLNGYSFILGDGKCLLDDFLNGTGAVVAEKEESVDDINMDCYIPYDGKQIEFSIYVTKNENDGQWYVRNLYIDSDRYFSEYQKNSVSYTEYEDTTPISCGFEFLGGYDFEETRIYDLPEDIVKYYGDPIKIDKDFGRDERQYDVTMLNARDDWYVIEINAIEPIKDSGEYFMRSVYISTFRS